VGLASGAEPPSSDPCAARPFSDGDLTRVLATAQNGLLYLWSPHMPYSVQGLEEIRELAARRRLTLVALLDPSADCTLAVRIAATRGFPRKALAYTLAERLFAHGATLHYPTLVLFREGRLLAAMLPGYVGVNVYQAFIDERLELSRP